MFVMFQLEVLSTIEKYPHNGIRYSLISNAWRNSGKHEGNESYVTSYSQNLSSSSAYMNTENSICSLIRPVHTSAEEIRSQSSM